MNRETILRGALWTSVPFNFTIAMLFVFPASPLAQFAGFPVPVPRVYGLLLAVFVSVFGGAYAWLARRPVIDRPLVLVAALCKAGVFAVVFACWLAGELNVRGALVASVDLAFAAIFGWWLLESSAPQARQ